MKQKTVTQYTLLRTHIGNYLAWFENTRTGLNWKVTPYPQLALNFHGNPNVLDTALKLFKKQKWKIVHATLTWAEK